MNLAMMLMRENERVLQFLIYGSEMRRRDLTLWSAIFVPPFALSWRSIGLKGSRSPNALCTGKSREAHAELSDIERFLGGWAVAGAKIDG